MHEIEIHGAKIVMRTLGTSLKEIMSERHVDPLTEITIDLEHWTMKLSDISVTNLATQLESVGEGLQVIQVLQRKIGKYQNNR